MEEDESGQQVESTALDKAYQELKPDQQAFVDATCERYDKLLSGIVSLSDEDRENARTLTKSFAINALKETGEGK